MANYQVLSLIGCIAFLMLLLPRNVFGQNNKDLIRITGDFVPYGKYLVFSRGYIRLEHYLSNPLFESHVFGKHGKVQLHTRPGVTSSKIGNGNAISVKMINKLTNCDSSSGKQNKKIESEG